MNRQAAELSVSLKDGVLSQVVFPATKAQILKAVNIAQAPEAVLRAAEMNLKDKVYTSADEVIQDLDIK